jgi:hypothetical protein
LTIPLEPADDDLFLATMVIFSMVMIYERFLDAETICGIHIGGSPPCRRFLFCRAPFYLTISMTQILPHNPTVHFVLRGTRLSS